MKTYCGRESPGPNSYQTPGGMGRQVDSKFKTEPGWKQGTQQRFNEKNPAREVPGVGTYASNVPSVGKQALSQKKTLPTPKIGTSQRDVVKKVGPLAPWLSMM